VIERAARVLGRPVPSKDCPRRPGDLAVMVADAGKAMSLLKWTPRHSTLEEIIATGAAWERGRRGKG
jgi:UDP-glucose 4-epimerase